VLVIDDSGDRKDGVKTAHVGHQWLGRYGKTGSGVVTVTTVWGAHTPVDAARALAWGGPDDPATACTSTSRVNKLPLGTTPPARQDAPAGVPASE
jgi:SRSO17 transposase